MIPKVGLWFLYAHVGTCQLSHMPVPACTWPYTHTERCKKFYIWGHSFNFPHFGYFRGWMETPGHQLTIGRIYLYSGPTEERKMCSYFMIISNLTGESFICIKVMKSFVASQPPLSSSKIISIPSTITLLSDWDLKVHHFEPGPPF